MKPIIRAAVDSGRPPLELLLDQPNRPRDRWDGKLIKALYINDAFEIEGYPIWVEESKSVEFKARAKTIRSLAAIEKKQEQIGKKKGGSHGVRVVSEVKLLPGKEWPTRAAWLAKQGGGSEKSEYDLEDEKMEQRAREAEERAAAKAAENPEIQAIIDEVQAKLAERAGRLEE